MSDDPGLFCVVVGAGFALASTVLWSVDRASGVACFVMGAVLVPFGAAIIWSEHRNRR